MEVIKIFFLDKSNADKISIIIFKIKYKKYVCQAFLLRNFACASFKSKSKVFSSGTLHMLLWQAFNEDELSVITLQNKIFF